MAIVATYKGSGEYYTGIPARSLDEDDWAALDDDQKKIVRDSGLYSVTERRVTAAETKAEKAREG